MQHVRSEVLVNVSFFVGHVHTAAMLFLMSENLKYMFSKVLPFHLRVPCL